MQNVLIRKNVLILVCTGYGVVALIFSVLAYVAPDQAFEAIEGPLMALIGGSLAIAKDLIPLNDSNSPNLSNGTNESGEQATQPDPKVE